MEKHTHTAAGKSFVSECRQHWPWFVGSACLALLLAIAFLLVTMPKYERNAAVLIKDENSAGGMLSSMVSNMGMLAGMAGINISSNVNNEMQIFSSPALMMEVVNRMGLDMRYDAYEGLIKKELWEETLPVKVTMPKLGDKDGAYLKIDLRQDGTFTLYKFRKNKEKFDEEVKGKVNSMCQTPLGPMSVIATKYFGQCLGKAGGEMTIRVTKEKKYDKVERLMKNLSVDLADDLTSVISLTCLDISGERAEKILNTLIQIYQEEWLKDKEDVANASTKFINERIKVIESDLGGLDKNIAQFKGQNLIPDYEETARMFMENAALTYETQVKVSNQLYMMEQMRNLIEKEAGTNNVLPANLLPDNKNVAEQIADYNKLQLRRNSMAENSSENNPMVKDLDGQLNSMRSAIASSLNHAIAQLRASQKSIDREDRKLKQQIAVTPEKVTKILPAERQQKIIEALYIYLLEKREENNMSQVFNSRNLRVITPPMGKLKPVFPKKMTTLAIALLIGLCLPVVGLYLRRNILGSLTEKQA